MSEWVIAERFEVRNTLGSGAHSTVLEVFDRFNENPRALKLSNGTTQRRRFREEFERLSRLRHPNVIRAYDLGLIILGCGANTLRFRPALTVTEADIDQGLDILAQAMKQTV